MNIIFSHKINQFRSLRTGEFILPDEGFISLMSKLNSNPYFDILLPKHEKDLVSWYSESSQYISFDQLNNEKQQEVLAIFQEFQSVITNHVKKILEKEYTNLKLEKQATTLSELLIKTTEVNNIRLFYSEADGKVGFAYGFAYNEQAIINSVPSQILTQITDFNDVEQQEANIIVDEGIYVQSEQYTKKTQNKRKQTNAWWINVIRSINWFAWRYWWLVWLLFILSLLLLYFFCPCKNKTQNSSCNQLQHIHKNIDALNGGMLFCCDCRREIPPIENDSIPALDSNEIFLPADFILITYQFDPSGGKDLDTRTNVESPTRGDVIGYCKPPRTSSNIVWSGDNTAYGVESVYVDINKYGSTDLIKILCKAFWFSQRNSGNMSLDIRAYKGGAMQRDGSNHYQFVNVGGEQVGDVISFPKNIIMKGAHCMTGEIIGTVKYNRANQSLSFE